jgi:hypothetical protein
MSPRFHAATFRSISAVLGAMLLSANVLPADAKPLKSTPNTNTCRQNSLLKSMFSSQLEEPCLNTEKKDSDQDTGNNDGKSTPDTSKEESTPASGDSHDFNLFKGNIIFQISPGGGGDSFSNGFTSPEPMQPQALPSKPSKKMPKKPKGVIAKPQKLVSPKSSNLNQLLPQKGIKPISPKYSPNIKSLILPTKSVRPILSRPNSTLRIRSVQPMIKQRPMLNPVMSRPVQRRSK